jgi:hypothetical protein
VSIGSLGLTRMDPGSARCPAEAGMEPADSLCVLLAWGYWEEEQWLGMDEVAAAAGKGAGW